MSDTERCAIYTRKSSEEGLNQDFNSLDAQREACEAYILSQKHEGWVSLPSFYDDGGLSGGTIERPALKCLLDDVSTAKVDIIVVYKMDRLTQSLSDFAKIVEVLDQQKVSFVSVTQQFNTTSSMGRLTLNMLLSFAQFEREVTSKRIRDKIAASKKKGMWMGGTVPLGYRVKDRSLVPHKEEAESVRHIFRRYVALGSVWDLQRELAKDGITSRIGNVVQVGCLYRLLKNPLYRGKVRHKEKVYPGLHKAIIVSSLWKQAQLCLSNNRLKIIRKPHVKEVSLLSGLVWDEGRQRLSPSHAKKGDRRYRYYVSQSLLKPGRPKKDACRIPARELESQVEQLLLALFGDPHQVSRLYPDFNLSDVEDVISHWSGIKTRWADMTGHDKREVMKLLIQKVTVRKDGVEVKVQLKSLSLNKSDTDSSLTLHAPVVLKRTGIEKRLIIPGQRHQPTDTKLIQLLSQAQRYQESLIQHQNLTLTDLAKHHQVSRPTFTRILKLSYLAPDITTAILEGSHPTTLTIAKLTREPIPSDSNHQWENFGFTPTQTIN